MQNKQGNIQAIIRMQDNELINLYATEIDKEVITGYLTFNIADSGFVSFNLASIKSIQINIKEDETNV